MKCDAKGALGMIDDLIAFVADKAGCSVDEVTWYSWPQVFGSTSGPRGGISGQVITTFQVYAFTAHGSKESVRAKILRRRMEALERRAFS